VNIPSGQLAIGCRFGRFKIIRFLGKGGMGEVYEAEHEDLGTSFAIKLINQDITDDPSVQLRFKQEARTNFGLRHANIVSVDDCNQVNGKYYIRMQLVQGMQIGDRKAVNLDEYLSLRGGRLPEVEVAQLLKDILSGLKVAHVKGIIHRDMKPANILMEDGNALLSDFGLAKLVGEEFFQSRIRLSIEQSKTIVRNSEEGGKSSGMGALEASYVGTYDFMAPEVKSGDDATTKSDLFAVGLIAYQLLTGKRSLGLKKPSQIVPDIDPGWDDWIAGATEDDPVLRTKSADEMLKTLPLLGERRVKKKKSFFFSRIAIFFYLLLAISGAGYYFYQHIDDYPVLKEKVQYLTDKAIRLRHTILEDDIPAPSPKVAPVVPSQDAEAVELPSHQEAVLDDPVVHEQGQEKLPEPLTIQEEEPFTEPSINIEPSKSDVIASDVDTTEVDVVPLSEEDPVDVKPKEDDAPVIQVIAPVSVAPISSAFDFPQTMSLVLPNGMMVDFVLCKSGNRKYYLSKEEVSEELYGYVVGRRDGMKNRPNYPVRLYEVDDLTHFFDSLNRLDIADLEPIHGSSEWIARLPSVSEWLNLYNTYKDRIPVQKENVGGSAFIPVAGNGSANTPVSNLIGNASEICVMDNYVRYKKLKGNHLRAYGLSFSENYTDDFSEYGRRLPADREPLWQVYGFRIMIEPKANTNK